MFVFLLGGVDFLLLFLFAAVEIASDVDIDVLGQFAEVALADVASLADESALGQPALLEELGEGGDDHLAAGSVDLVQPNSHVWLIILKYI
jgi:hypothetical protein